MRREIDQEALELLEVMVRQGAVRGIEQKHSGGAVDLRVASSRREKKKKKKAS